MSLFTMYIIYTFLIIISHRGVKCKDIITIRITFFLDNLTYIDYTIAYTPVLGIYLNNTYLPPYRTIPVLYMGKPYLFIPTLN